MTPTPFVIDVRPLAKRRKKLDVTQRQLAEGVGVTHGCISNYERNVRPLPLAILVGCSRALGVPMTDLFTVKENR